MSALNRGDATLVPVLRWVRHCISTCAKSALPAIVGYPIPLRRGSISRFCIEYLKHKSGETLSPSLRVQSVVPPARPSPLCCHPHGSGPCTPEGSGRFEPPACRAPSKMSVCKPELSYNIRNPLIWGILADSVPTNFSISLAIPTNCKGDTSMTAFDGLNL